MGNFQQRRHELEQQQAALLARPNQPQRLGNGLYDRYKYPVLTAQHVPLAWRYDFNPSTNPFLMERLGVNAVFNAGAIRLDGRYLLVARALRY